MEQTQGRGDERTAMRAPGPGTPWRVEPGARGMLWAAGWTAGLALQLQQPALCGSLALWV